MSNWIITGVQPLDSLAVPEYDPAFKMHMMSGEIKDKSHRGLHSLNEILTDDYNIAEGDLYLDGDCPLVFSAKVKLVGNVADVKKYSKKREWLEPKLSFFFPTSMTFAEVQKAVTLAYQNYKGATQGHIQRRAKHESTQEYNPVSKTVDTVPAKVSYEQAKSDSMHAFTSKLKKLKVSDLGVKWAGQVKIQAGAGKPVYIIWLGSPEMGTNSSKLLSAFPAVGGKFI